MTTIRTALLFSIVGILGVSACRGKPTCLDCGEDIAAEDDDAPPVPDLPCGGADLMTDNLNCGTCGHECQIWYDDTKYEAGTCTAGACGRGGWSDCIPESVNDLWITCSDVCNALNRTCVSNGCAGLTGLMFAVNFDGWGCDAYSYEPAATISGGCDEPIPWMSTGEKSRDVQCCCDYQ
jgi:hypothetical protein